jgi:hypothetical protein
MDWLIPDTKQDDDDDDDAEQLLLLEKQLLLLQLYMMSRNRSYLKRWMVDHPRNSPWNKVKQDADDTGFKAILGVDRGGFNYLVFLVLRNQKWVTQARYLDPEDLVGVALYYMHSQCSQSTLCQIFGWTPAVMCRNIWISLHIMVATLKDDQYCKVRWPSSAEYLRYSELINKYKPGFNQNSIGFIDGTRVRIKNFGDSERQNGYYNRKYKSNIGCLFVVSPIGTIIWYSINNPGSWSDGRMAVELYDYIDRLENKDFTLIADQAFSHGKFILSATRSGHLTEMQREMLTQIRTAVEWNMKDFKQPWSRIENRFGVDIYKNETVLRTAIYLTNFRANFMEISQIRSVYLNNNSMRD